MYPGASFCAGPRMYFNLKGWKWALFLNALHAENKCLKNLVNFYLKLFEYLMKTFGSVYLILIDLRIKYLTMTYRTHNAICDSLLVPDSFNK